jgi:hypothetical protein
MIVKVVNVVVDDDDDVDNDDVVVVALLLFCYTFQIGYEAAHEKCTKTRQLLSRYA